MERLQSTSVCMGRSALGTASKTLGECVNNGFSSLTPHKEIIYVAIVKKDANGLFFLSESLSST